jgi:hypothetical protein
VIIKPGTVVFTADDHIKVAEAMQDAWTKSGQGKEQLLDRGAFFWLAARGLEALGEIE